MAAQDTFEPPRAAAQRPDEASTIVSVGYEGCSAEELVDALVDAGVSVLVDVRENAISRKRGLSKRALGEKLEARGITYVHEPTLGNPRDNREGFREQRPDSVAAFEAHLRRNGSAALDRVTAMLVGRTVGLLCFEADPCSCHRSIVARHLQDRDPLATVRDCRFSAPLARRVRSRSAAVAPGQAVS